MRHPAPRTQQTMYTHHKGNHIMTKKLLAAGAALAASALVLTACSGSGGGASGADTADTDYTAEATGTLNAWGFDSADEVGTSRLDYAADKMDGVTVKIDATPFDAQKFTTLVTSGNVPDVVQLDRRLVATYAEQGLIQPVTKCFDAHDVDADEQYYPFVVDDVRYKDELWAVPQFYQPPAIIVNTRVLDDAGVSIDAIDTSDMDALTATAKKMYKESGGNPVLLGFDPVSGGYPELWIQGQGGQLVDDEGAPTLDSTENAEAITKLIALSDAQGGFAKIKSFSDTFDFFGDKNQFVTDQVGAQVDAQWYPNVLVPYADQIEISAVPFRSPDGEPFAVSSGTSFVVPTGAENPSAACTWMLDLTSTDAWMVAGAARDKTLQEQGTKINTGLFTGNPTADQKLREKYTTAAGNEGFQKTIDTFYEALTNGVSAGASPAGQEVKDELANAISSALLGDKSPEDALKEAQAAAQRAYDRAAQ